MVRRLNPFFLQASYSYSSLPPFPPSSSPPSLSFSSSFEVLLPLPTVNLFSSSLFLRSLWVPDDFLKERPFFPRGDARRREKRVTSLLHNGPKKKAKKNRWRALLPRPATRPKQEKGRGREKSHLLPEAPGKKRGPLMRSAGAFFGREDEGLRCRLVFSLWAGDSNCRCHGRKEWEVGEAPSLIF